MNNQQNTMNPIPHLRQDIKAEIKETVVKPPQLQQSILRAQVDEIIHNGLNDMWLLIDGEDMDTTFESGIWRDGKAFAMVTANQVSLLGPKFSALNALLSVGIQLQ